MEVIRGRDIERGIRETGRTYMAGNLERPNASPYVKTDGYETGITEYHAYAVEEPHRHGQNQEYNYVLSGFIKLVLLDEQVETLFEAGDFYVIEPGEAYVAKCVGGTRILFAKVPGGDDKQVIEPSERIRKWGERWNAAF